VHWIHGGRTDLDNCVLLCNRHHHMVHEGGWQMVKTDDQPILAVPPPE
jgi:predicted restriction endonuclease